MPLVERTITIKAPAEEVYQVIRDVERYPRFVPDVKEVRIISEDPQGRITRWHAVIDGVAFRWTERDEYDGARMMVKYRLVEGDLEKFEGEWRVDQDGESARVTLTLEYELGIPAFDELMGASLFERMVQAVQGFLMAIKEEMERGV